MPFLIRYSTDSHPGSTYAVAVLSPGPTEVDYPEFRLLNKRVTQDSAVVIQRPIIDSRERKWTWKNYRDTIATYANQWEFLLTLEARKRYIDDRNPIIQIWENESAEGGFGETTDSMDPDLIGYTNISWTQVKFLQVHRKSRSGGGHVVYDDSFVEFVIADPQWENF